MLFHYSLATRLLTFFFARLKSVLYLKLILWLAFIAFVATTSAQTVQCGVIGRDTLTQPADYFDRFGNGYTESELREIYQNSTFMECANTGEFNLLFETITYQGNTYPSAEQEEVICDVFAYLAGLIEAPGTGGLVNLQIVFDPSLAGSGNGAIGTPLFSHQCGIGYSIVQEQLNTQSPALPADFIHGYIRINPEYDWYTEVDLTPTITSQQIDLHTVVLHEALHVLGFGSQIGASGNSLQGFYTLYDLHLENTTGDPMILSSVDTGECCLEYEFNSTDFPNMPTPILTCGNIEYDVAQTPPVHGQYSSIDDATAANILSHLNITCGSEDYVMHASIGFGASTNGISNIRRALTAAETNILCSLGYDMDTECEAECFVIVQDDGPFVLNEATEILPYAWLTANDFDADGNYQIQFDFTCGDVGNLTFTPNGTTGELTITLNSTPFGEYEFCYTIFSCNGELCQSGTVELIVAEEIDPSVCLGEDCNLVGFGDFELFPPGYGAYYPSLADPWNSEVILIPNPDLFGAPANTVDIFTDGNNQFAGLIRCNNCHQENLLMPLCEEIPADCDITVSFQACATASNVNQPVFLGVWALSSLPSNLELANTTVCNGILMDNLGNVIGTCLGEVLLEPQCTFAVAGPGSPLVTQPFDFVSYTIALPSGFSEPITHLWFFDYPSYQLNIRTFLDNISVTTSCQNEVTITPTVLEACIDGQAVIDLEVCLDGELQGSADITIEPDIQGIPGISLSTNNPDFPNGTATVEDLDPGECVTLTLFLDISSGFQPGTEITFPLDLEVDGACVENPDGQTVTITLEECDTLNCDCPSGSIVIGEPGVETFLANLVANSTLPAMPQFNQPLNITIRGTLVINANDITSTQDGDYLFPPLSDVCMDAGAEIRIPPNNTLTILDSHIRGCDRRWKSITVEHDATLLLAGDGLGLVEDGQYAVHPRNKSTVDIRNTDFNKNYEALHFNDPLGEFFLQPFFGNNMYCTQNLLPHYDDQDPNDGPWSYAGIHTIGQDFLTIGVANMAVNRFDTLRNGIITENCNLTLRNSRFNNIQYLDYSIAGYGVRASGTGHNFMQDGTCYANNTVFFDDCKEGIFLRGMNADVHNNEMNNVWTGITVRESQHRDIEICGNIINCSFTGISLQLNDPAERIQVNNNTIDLISPNPNLKAAAIRVSEHGAPQPNAHIEFHDNIDILDAGSGIALSGCNGYHVEQNFIDAALTQNGSLKYAGISLYNSPNNFLSCNDVDGDFETHDDGNEYGPTGIKATASMGVEYDCNDVQDTYLGVQFDMGCNNTRFRTTTFDNHHFGLHYAATGVTGHQPMNLTTGTLHGNRWNGTWGGSSAVGARHESQSINWVNDSRYIVRSISAPWGPQNPSSVSSTWFDDDNRFEFSCGSTCDVWLTGDTTITELDERIAKGLVDPGVYTEPMQWMLERGLYRKLYANSEFVQPFTFIDTFYTAKSSTTIGRFTAVEAATYALFELDSSTAGQLQDFYELTTEQMEGMALIDSLLQTVSGQDSLNLLVRREYALDSIESLSLLNSALVKSILQARSAAANSIIAQNNAIAVSDIWEQNEKTVNHIFLNTIAKGIPLNTTQFNLLKAVANQCPYEGGTAVFRARAILDIEVDDEVACSQLGSHALVMPPLSNQAISTSMFLYPNPASNTVTVKFLTANEAELELSIYNLYGQTVAKHKLHEGTTEYSFSTMTLSQGFYLVRIMEGNKAVFTTRLVIAR